MRISDWSSDVCSSDLLKPCRGSEQMLRSAPCFRCVPIAAALQRGGSDDDPVSRLGDNLRHRPRGIEPMAVNSNIILPPFKTVDGQPINKVRISGTANEIGRAHV